MEVGVPEEMKSLGVFGICREARNIISMKKIFNQITIAFILPLSLIFLAQTQVSDYLSAKIIYNQKVLVETQIGTPKYNDITHLLFSEYTALVLLKSAYLLFALIFSLLSTSAVVYTTACISTGQKVTFSKVLSVVPKVWKRLIVTLITVLAVFFAYNIVAGLLLISLIAFIGITSYTSFLIFSIVVVFYLIGLVYMSIVWQLANTVSVLEDSYGIEAMKRSSQLIKGKVGVSVFFLFGLGFCFIIVQAGFQMLVVHVEWQEMVNYRAVYAIICLFLHVMLVLYGHVFHTIIYLVCKSYHDEDIEKLALSDRLEAYSDYQHQYVPLKGEEDESGQLMV